MRLAHATLRERILLLLRRNVPDTDMRNTMRAWLTNTVFRVQVRQEPDTFSSNARGVVRLIWQI